MCKILPTTKESTCIAAAPWELQLQWTRWKVLGVTITEDDIIAGSFSIDRNWSQGETLEIGCADTAELTFELDNSDGKWNSVRWEGAQLTVLYDIAGEPLQAGIFTVDERPAKLTTLQIRALDHMARFNRPYVPGISYPATLFQILQDTCNQCNVNLLTLSFDNDSYIVDNPPEDAEITCHQIVTWVAELAGCNAWIDQLARLQLSWYGENQPGSPPITLGPDDRFSYQLAEGDITITGVIFRTQDIDYLAGSAEYALIIEDNPLLQEDYESILAALYNKLGGFSYRPYEFSCLGHPHLWPGDRVDELRDAEGNVISSIITNHTYTLNGNSLITAKGETETVRGYATGAPFTSSQKRVLETVAAQEAARQVSSVEQATLELNQLMTNSLGYYSTTIEEPTGAKRTYTHDQPTLQDSTYIWTQTELGFAWTDQGWNDGDPVWQYGVTVDGSMVIRVISAVGIKAEWIDVDDLSAITGNFSELRAGEPAGAYLQLGEASGMPYMAMHDSAGELRVELLQDRYKYYDELGRDGGEILSERYTEAGYDLPMFHVKGQYVSLTAEDDPAQLGRTAQVQTTCIAGELPQVRLAAYDIPGSLMTTNLYVSQDIDLQPAGRAMVHGNDIVAIEEKVTSGGITCIRFTDGTQICYGVNNITRAINLTWGQLYYSPNWTITFPRPFAAVPAFFGQTIAAATTVWLVADGTWTGSSVIVAFVRPTSLTSRSITYTWQAVGRWL